MKPMGQLKTTAKSPIRALALLMGGAMLLSACASQPAPSRSDSGAAAPSAPAAPKTLRIGTLKEPNTGIAVFAGSSNMSAQHIWMFHAGLTALDQQGNIQPRIAQKIPSINDGDWKVNPDGTMEVTWKLRPNVKWHDGTPLTADDFVLGIQIAKDPEIPLPHTGQVALIKEVVAPDAQTLVVRWSQPYFGANQPSPVDEPAVPRRIMGDLYAQADKQPLINSPYWTKEFVGLGPYKLNTWVPGSYTEAIAFDDYFLGRPKIDRVILRYIIDATVLATNLISGDLDLVAIGSLKADDLAPVKSAWEPQGGGTVIEMMTDVTWGRWQFRDQSLPFARDARVRQALMHLIDRQMLADTFFPGGSAPADLFVAPEDPVFRMAMQRGAGKYPYDLTAAARLLNDAGWTRGADGVYQNTAGQHLNAEVRVVANTPGNVQQGLAISDQWKRGGIDAPLFSIPGNAVDKNQQKTMGNQGIFVQPTSIDPTVYEGLTSPLIASEANGWSAANLSGYSNPDYDRLFSLYANELDVVKRESFFADVVKRAADEVLFAPLYYSSGSATTSFRRGVRGPTATLPTQPVTTWNMHEWEMD
jgi:peptide/nickel transport system substrate-binding protein